MRGPWMLLGFAVGRHKGHKGPEAIVIFVPFVSLWCFFRSIAFVKLVPSAAITGQKLIGSFRAPRTGGIFHQAFISLLFPRLEDRLNDGPAQLRHVGAAEQRRVADHAVV